MVTAHEERMTAARLPGDTIVAVLYEQHARIRDQFDAVAGVSGDDRAAAFDSLRELIATHQAAEDVVLRTVTDKLLPAGLTREATEEEQAVARELADLERVDVGSPQFLPRLRLLEEAFDLHAEHEEAEEFPAVLAELSEKEQVELGHWMKRATRIAPTHPHPALAGHPVTEAVTTPFTALYDEARDRLAEAHGKAEGGSAGGGSQGSGSAE
jgi:hypothetical protein